MFLCTRTTENMDDDQCIDDTTIALLKICWSAVLLMTLSRCLEKVFLLSFLCCIFLTSCLAGCFTKNPLHTPCEGKFWKKSSEHDNLSDKL